MSFKNSSALIRSLVIPAVLLLHLGAAAAADSTDSVSQSQRELLAGRTATELAPPQTQSSNVAAYASDTQALVQEQLLGTKDRVVETQAADAPASVVSGVYASDTRNDAQILAQRVLLGSRGGVAAGS